MKKLIDIVNILSGSLILIGIDDKLVIETINNNSKLTNIDLLSDLKTKNIGGLKVSRDKSINIKKFKKHFKKKKHDTIICNYNKVEKHLHHFIKDSIYITKKSIYYVYDDKEDVIRLKKRYRRYNVSFTTISDDILKIDVTKAKSRIVYDKIYYIIDLFSYLTDILSEMLLK